MATNPVAATEEEVVAAGDGARREYVPEGYADAQEFLRAGPPLLYTEPAGRDAFSSSPVRAVRRSRSAKTASKETPRASSRTAR